jgi:hypothetical protein
MELAGTPAVGAFQILGVRVLRDTEDLVEVSHCRHLSPS